MRLAKKILEGVGEFSEADIQFFESRAIQKKFKKDEMLLKKGDTCVSAFYIITGAAYQFIDDNNILDFHIPEDWCLNYSSFIMQQPSKVSIKAYSDVEAVELKINVIHELIEKSSSFFQLGKILEQTVMRLQYYDNESTAEEKHNHLFKTKPQVFQKFPLKMIASYLKLAPETLSRIRAKK